MFSRIMWLGYFSFTIHLVFVLGFNFPCDEKTHFQCQDGDCVTASWRCDGLSDCDDGSDEDDCPSQSCLPHDFFCGGGKCLPSNWVCDGKVHCSDRSDEAPETCDNRSCRPTEFACRGRGTSHCIPKAWLCDGEKDCNNGADEIDCGEGKLAPAPPTDIPRKTPGMTSTMEGETTLAPGNTGETTLAPGTTGETTLAPSTTGETTLAPSTTGETTVTPGSTGETTLAPVQKVVPATPKPPHITILPKPHTELPPPVVQPVTFPDVNRLHHISKDFSCDEKIHFQCQSGDCVTASWRCDGLSDCGDGSDEEDCPSQSCMPHDFVCGGGKCLPSNWVCDGEVDCTDRSDEGPETCASQSCPPDEFVCGGGECLPSSWVCDGEVDCNDRSDEALATCHNRTCPPTEFACGGRVISHCISKAWLCDGKEDCNNGADETDCGEGKLAPAPPTDIPRKTPSMTLTTKGKTILAPDTTGETTLAPGSTGERTLPPVQKVVPATPNPPQITILPKPHTAEPALQGKGNNSSPAAASVIVPLLLVLACAAGFYIFRKRRLLEVKTSRFENPEYMKTPDGEEFAMDCSWTDDHTYLVMPGVNEEQH